MSCCARDRRCLALAVATCLRSIVLRVITVTARHLVAAPLTHAVCVFSGNSTGELVCGQTGMLWHVKRADRRGLSKHVTCRVCHDVAPRHLTVTRQGRRLFLTLLKGTNVNGQQASLVPPPRTIMCPTSSRSDKKPTRACK